MIMSFNIYQFQFLSLPEVCYSFFIVYGSDNRNTHDYITGYTKPRETEQLKLGSDEIRLGKNRLWNSDIDTPLRGCYTPGPYFWRLCIFSKNWATLGKISNGSEQKCSKELKKAQFYFSRDHGCEVTVNNVWKSIFSMFCPINQ